MPKPDQHLEQNSEYSTQPPQRWVFWSTRETLRDDIPSVTAILETLLAISVYWWVAVKYETYSLLLLSVAVAPLVLLRSSNSIRLGAAWFTAWEKQIWNAKAKHGVSGGIFISILVGLGVYFIAVNLRPILKLGVCGNDLYGCTTFFILITVFIITGALIVIIEMVLRRPILLVRMKPETAFATGPIPVALRTPFYIGFAVGVFVISLLFRTGATVRYIFLGMRVLPDNFRKLVVCTSPLQEPELVPGLGNRTIFRLGIVLDEFRTRSKSHKASDKIFAFGALLPAALLWFFPTWLYRVTLKSTAWFWWPLAFLGAKLQRAKDPDEFHRTTLGSLWARTSITLAMFTITVFIWMNFVQTGAIFKDNPFITVLGYFFIVDWSMWPWQLFPIALALLSIVIVYLVDDASGQYRLASAKGYDEHMIRAQSKFGWIERLIRFRLVLFLIFLVVVGIHALLYLNSLACWFVVPSNVGHWAQWTYGDRTPPLRCPKFM